MSRGAMQTAQVDFGLLTMRAVVGFIHNGGLQNPVHSGTEIWANNRNPSTPIWVDAYSFQIRALSGRLEFLWSQNNQWMIKTFKKNIVQAPGADPLVFSPFKNLPKLKP